MGISIHYSGKLRDLSDLPSLVDEVTDICQSLKWRCEYVTPQPDIPIKGVMIGPEKSDPLLLTFLPGGGLCHPVLYFCVKEVEDMSNFESAETWLGTRMQDAGPEAHMELIRILRHLSNKYFDRFQVHDDSKFWETNDEEQCRLSFAISQDHFEFPVNIPDQFAGSFRSKKSILKRKLRRRE